MGRGDESRVTSPAETAEHAVANTSLRTSALREFSFCPDVQKHTQEARPLPQFRSFGIDWVLLTARQGPLLGVIPNPRKGKTTVPNKLAPLNAKENLSHEMEILKQVM